MKRQFALAGMVLGLALLLVPFIAVLNTAAGNSSLKTTAIELARLGDQVTVRAAGLGAPRINLADGRDLLNAYAGDPEAQRLLNQNIAQPLGLASADFNEDGVPDIVTAFAAPNGGILTLQSGNVDSIYPNAPEAKQRKAAGTFTNAPFLSPARAIETPQPGDFIGGGDFDADGHMDVVTAARGSRALFFFLGDGHGNLSAARQLDLPGSVTVLITGEINRADGLADIIAGVSGAAGPKVLLFQAPDGALRANPEAFPLPGEASALALGQFDNGFPMDLAIATGRELMIVRGRAQSLALPQTKRLQASIDRRPFELAIRALAVGDFTGQHHDDLAILSDNGSVHILSREVADSSAKSRKSEPLRKWHYESLPGSWPQARLLMSAHVASTPLDNVVVIDSQAHRVQLIAKKTAAQDTRKSSGVSESIDVDDEPVAALPMRLNADAVSDLVILRKARIAPSIVTTLSAMTFTVANTGDNGGVDPVPFSGTGTLRQAIVDANTNSGADTISFAIGSGPKTISPAASLPVITEAVTIDGTTQPGFSGNPIIELDGTAVSGDGLFVQGGASTIRGLVINRFGGAGIVLQTSGGNIIEGNFIGTVLAGNAGAPNSGSGVSVGSNSNRIGGTVAAASNLLSSNIDAGVSANGAISTLIQGNRIGTDLTGTTPLANSPGIDLSSSTSATIGGTAAGAGNIISGNNGPGVFLEFSTQSTLVQGNFIGTDITGASALGNTEVGVVLLSGASNNSIGGTSIGAGNRIAFNSATGIVDVSGTGNAFLSNSISDNGFLGIDVEDDGSVTPNDDCDVDSGSNDVQNFPVLTSANSNGSNTAITGSLNSTVFVSFRIEFFSNPLCDDSGFGQGKTFLGATNVTTASDCGATFSVVFPVAVTPGQVVTATATNSTNSTSEFSKCLSVSMAGCAISCPPNIVAFTPPSATSCSTAVSYPPPTTTGSCGAVSCVPPAGSQFTVGTTTVNCSVVGGPNCSFLVSVVDNTPPAITCLTGFTALLPAGQSSTIVNYPAATASDNCTAASVVCAPPPGATFAAGSTLVTCTAFDTFENQNRCSFFVTVFDAEVPMIKCPANVSATLPAGQTSTVVTYPPPTVTDNRPGATAVCVPASGSTFSAGTTTVTCTAIDADRNSSNCSFVVSVGAPQLKVTIPGNKTTVEFATLPPTRKIKSNKIQCSLFTVENIGFTPLTLTFDSLRRTGTDVTNGRISDPNDVNAVDEVPATRFFSLSLVNSNQSLTPFNVGTVLTLQAGQAQVLCLKFAPLIPRLTGKTTGLAASDVLPDVVTSKITFKQNGGSNVDIPIVARVATGVVLINPDNPRKAPFVTFTRSGNDITVSYAVFDSNLDVSKAKYEFLDANGQVVAGPFEIDLAQSLSSANLVRGQSFSVEQKFTGASDSPQITGVRVTVFDGETSTVGSSSASDPVIVISTKQLIKERRGVTLYPPAQNLNRMLP